MGTSHFQGELLLVDSTVLGFVSVRILAAGLAELLSPLSPATEAPAINKAGALSRARNKSSKVPLMPKASRAPWSIKGAIFFA